MTETEREPLIFSAPISRPATYQENPPVYPHSKLQAITIMFAFAMNSLLMARIVTMTVFVVVPKP